MDGQHKGKYQKIKSCTGWRRSHPAGRRRRSPHHQQHSLVARPRKQAPCQSNLPNTSLSHAYQDHLGRLDGLLSYAFLSAKEQILPLLPLPEFAEVHIGSLWGRCMGTPRCMLPCVGLPLPIPARSLTPSLVPSLVSILTQMARMRAVMGEFDSH